MTGSRAAAESFDAGMLDVGDGHRVYWEVSGNPEGEPAVVLHGGPGSGMSPAWRRFFDTDAYRLVMFDQRGCGRSEAHASEPTADLSTNTTHHLVADIERLRHHLAVDRWLVFGLSWGSTLGLAYAQAHPGRVRALVLGMVVTSTAREVEWVTRDVGRLSPEAWQRFRDGVPEPDRDGSLVDAYSRLLHDPDPAIRDEAARAWCTWEDTHVAILGEPDPDPRFEDPRYRLCFARLVTHYWRHAAFLGDGVLRAGMARLAGIPGVLVHGRRDLSSPLDVPWHLHARWPDSRVVVVDEGAHAGTGGMEVALRDATDRFVRG